MLKAFQAGVALAAFAISLAASVAAEDIPAAPPAPIVNAGTATSSPEAVPAPAQSAAQADSAAAATAPAPQAAVAPKPRPQPTLNVTINLSAQTMTVQENGVLRYVWPISSGRAGYRTPTGTYRGQWMSRMHYSRKYDNAPMPHSVFFHNGYAIHATYATGMLGRPASHGCIRLSPGNAKTFYGMVGRHGLTMTRISINGVARDSSPAVAQPRTYRPKTYAAYGFDGASVGPAKAKLHARAPGRKAKSGQYGYASVPQYAPTYAPKYTWPGDAPKVSRHRYGSAGYRTYR
ncbi:MAG: L,D-transpeptidase family protein [Hyphomicrobiaceae bacterium]|nr:L,D-transpeptidase family protein [Hyphomicrobiaceae bacterium]